MKNYSYILVLLIIILHGTDQSSQSKFGLVCVNDYLLNISCVWWNSSDFSDQRCELEGIRDLGSSGRRIAKCDMKSSDSYSARGCSVTFDLMTFVFIEKIWLHVYCNGSLITKLHYQPGRHIKTQPPDKPTVSGANISWSRGVNFPEDVEQYEFELQFKSASTSWEMSRPQVSHDSFAFLDHELLTIGEEYQARVRVKPVESIDEGYFQGEWSDWSPAVSWRSEIGRLDPPLASVAPPALLNNIHTVLIVGFHVLLVIAGMSLIIYKARKNNRLLKPKHQHVPDPSKYFQPLHVVYGGNFQKWLGCPNTDGLFLTPQSCDDISPVEVSDIWDASLRNARLSSTALLHTNQVDSGLENSGTSQASSGISNMGYFYSKSHTGSLYLETCPVYFTYNPEEVPNTASSSSSSSFDCLQSPSYLEKEPISPDSGFDMAEEEKCEENHDDEARNEEEMGVMEENPLVSFFTSLSQDSLGSVRPAESFPPMPVVTPWSDPVREFSYRETLDPAEGAVGRPSSMIEPCGGGYLTLKEMQKFSNKSI